MNVFELCAVLKLNKDAYEQGLSEAEKSSGNIGENIGNAFKKMAEVSVVAIGATATALTSLVKSSVEAYADYEQLVGGVETLFGTGGKSVEEYAQSVGKTVDEVKDEYNALDKAQRGVFINASNAYATAGLSMNEYMETVTGFSASLISSLGGDTVKAMELADRAITDMSDNANKMGSSMESIQNAYAGFAKQNYTMLDNLKLGYGGTKEEMQRLLEDATAISGIEYDISSYADVVTAIGLIQDQMGITGTTAEEAEKTISGSIGMMKASWQNLLTGFANGNGDLYDYMDNFVASLKTVLKNVIPIVKHTISSISLIIKDSVPILVQEILPIITDEIPAFLDVIIELINDALPVIVETFANVVPSLVTSVVNLLIANLPIIITGVSSMVLTLANSLAGMLPTLVPALVTMLVGVVNTLISNIPMLIDCALQLVIGLTQGILQALPTLIEAMPQIIIGLVDALLNGIPQIIETGVDLLIALISDLPYIISEIVKAIPQIMTGIINSFTSYFTKMNQLGKDLVTKIGNGILSLGSWIYEKAGNILTNVWDAVKGLPDKMLGLGVELVKGLWNGIKSMGSWLHDKLFGWADDIIDSVAGFFGVASPSREMRDRVGKYLPMGMAVGIDQTANTVLDSANAIKSDVLGTFEDMNKQMDATLNGNYSVDISKGSSEGGYSLKELSNMLSEWLPQIANTQIVLDTGATVGQLAPAMDEELGRRLAYASRGV